LLVTPVAYSLFDDMGTIRLFGRAKARSADRALPAGATLDRPSAATLGRTSLIALFGLGLAATAFAQTPAIAPPTLRLTVDEAVKMALDHNVDLNADRFDPQIGDTRVAAAAGAFAPTVSTAMQSNNQLQPPSNFLTPIATRTDVISTNAGVSQRLPWFGTSYSAAWTTAHTNSNSFLNSYNPILQSGLSLNVSQPLPRGSSSPSAGRIATSPVRVCARASSTPPPA
jgi:hypothetical protein